MKQFFSLSTFIFLLLSLIIVSSCKKDDLKESSKFLKPVPLSTKTQFKVENNTLIIESFDDYNILIQELSQKSGEEIDLFFKEQGLHNLSNIYNNLYDELNVIDENEIINFVKKNKKYLLLRDLGDDEQEVISTSQTFHNYFANEDFIFKIGNDIIDVREIGTEVSYTKSCGNPQEVIFTINQNGCRNDRRAKLKVEAMRLLVNVPNGDITVEFSTELRGQRKRGCIWVGYRTDLDLLIVPQLEAEYLGTNYLSNFNGQILNCLNCNNLLLFMNVAATNLPRPIPLGVLANLTSATAIGTTNGIGANSVIINCND